MDNFKKYENIIGVYGFLGSMPDATFWDKLFMNGFNFSNRILNKKEQFLIHQGAMGVMGFTNAIILKKLWDKRHFNEEYGVGGEDGEWANYWFSQGYKAVKDWKFTVLHSHYLGLIG